MPVSITVSYDKCMYVVVKMRAMENLDMQYDFRCNNVYILHLCKQRIIIFDTHYNSTGWLVHDTINFGPLGTVMQEGDVLLLYYNACLMHGVAWLHYALEITYLKHSSSDGIVTSGIWIPITTSPERIYGYIIVEGFCNSLPHLWTYLGQLQHPFLRKCLSQASDSTAIADDDWPGSMRYS